MLVGAVTAYVVKTSRVTPQATLLLTAIRDGSTLWNLATASQKTELLTPVSVKVREAPVTGPSPCSRVVMLRTTPKVPAPPPLMAQYRSEFCVGGGSAEHAVGRDDLPLQHVVGREPVHAAQCRVPAPLGVAAADADGRTAAAHDAVPVGVGGGEGLLDHHAGADFDGRAAVLGAVVGRNDLRRLEVERPEHQAALTRALAQDAKVCILVDVRLSKAKCRERQIHTHGPCS